MVEVGGHGVDEDGVDEDRSMEVFMVEGVVTFVAMKHESKTRLLWLRRDNATAVNEFFSSNFKSPQIILFFNLQGPYLNPYFSA